MKNKVCLFVLLALFGWSCADKTITEPDVPTREVSFSVSLASGSPTKTSSTSSQNTSPEDAIFDEIEIVTLFIYNSKGYVVGEYKRWRGMDDKVFVTALEEGDYTVVAVGNNGDWPNNSVRLSSARAHNNYRGQVFLDKAEFNVNASEKNDVSLVLKRKVGRLDIDITDEPPISTFRVRVSIQAMPTEYAFQSFLPVGSEPISFSFMPRNTWENDFPAYFFVPENSSAFKASVLLELIGFNSQILKSQWLHNVTVGVNMKTTIRGKFYDSKQQEFTIEAAEEWSEEDIIDF